MIPLTFGFQYTTLRDLFIPLLRALCLALQIALILFLIRLIKFYEFQMVFVEILHRRWNSTPRCLISVCICACMLCMLVNISCFFVVGFSPTRTNVFGHISRKRTFDSYSFYVICEIDEQQQQQQHHKKVFNC